MKLTIELVPKSCWYSNVRSEVSKEKWDELRRETYAKAGHCCEVCGGKGPRWPVECHEIWDYNDEQKKQTLKGLIALCPDCHECKHMGRAQVVGRGLEAAEHFAKVNGINISEASRAISEAFDVWRERSQHQWELDISWLDNHEEEV